jgi:lipoyl(octanoyl) transferase
MILRVQQLGIVPYQQAWDLQRHLVEERRKGHIPDTLLLLQHPPTITFGRFSSAKNLVASPETLKRLQVEVVPSDRGGDITLHAPGQLVGYPIFDLQSPPHKPDVHNYLRLVEEALIQTLAAYSLKGWRFPGYTGVWVDGPEGRPEKIAAIGIRIHRWITHHGFAFNVTTDLSLFQLIVPCGIQAYGVTSLLRQTGHSYSIEEVGRQAAAAFATTFGHDNLEFVPQTPQAPPREQSA